MTKLFGLLKEELPREKLIKHGPEYLTDVELLAIILRVGTKEKNVIELSREIIENFSYEIVSRKTYEELLEFKGISYAKACQIVSVFELARRFSNKKQEKKEIQILNSYEVYDLVKSSFLNLDCEKVMAVFVNVKNIIIKSEFISTGSLNYSIIEPRDLIKRALNLNASGFFLIHNHPSGDINPSEDDIIITQNISKISKNLNLRFLDHIIIGKDDFYSFYDESII